MGEDLPVSFSLCAAFVVLVSAGTLTNVYLFRLYGTKSGSEMPGPRRGWAQSWEFPASSLGDFLHAMDFLRYSYLQSGQEAKAREVIEHTNHVVGANKESKADHHALFAAWTALEFAASLRRFLSGPAAAFSFFRELVPRLESGRSPASLPR